MAMINFMIVLFFNIYFMRNGIKGYLELYKWSENRWLSVLVWTYLFWGIGNLVYFLLQY